jgi:hypothetical protein
MKHLNKKIRFQRKPSTGTDKFSVLLARLRESQASGLYRKNVSVLTINDGRIAFTLPLLRTEVFPMVMPELSDRAWREESLR